MGPTTWVVVAVLQAVSPSNNAEKVEWGEHVGHELSKSGTLRYTLSGPRAAVFELYAHRGWRGKRVSVRLLRDGRYLSTNTRRMRPNRAPKRMQARLRIGVEVPEGEHTYSVEANANLVVSVQQHSQMPRRTLAAAEEKEQPRQVEATADATAPSSSSGDGETGNTSESGPSEAGATTSETASDETSDATGSDAAAGTIADANSPESILASSAEAADKVGSAPPTRDASSAQSRPANLTKALRVAVYDLEAEGIEANLSRVVTDSLLQEVRKLEGVSAIGMDEIRDMLSFEADKQMLGCEDDESCLAEIAGALGVDDLITGKISQVDEGSAVFLIRRIDQGRAEVAGVVNRRLKVGSGEEFLATVGPAVEELFPQRPIREGEQRGVPKEMALKLDPPPLPQWSTLSVGGGAVLAAAAGGVFGILTGAAQRDYDEYALEGTDGDPIDGATLVAKGDRLQTNARTANILFGAAGGLALTSGLMALWTDWWGYGEN